MSFPLSGAGTDNLIYQITDHLGSVRAVRRGNGTVERRFDYYPFGSVSRFWNDTPVEVSDSGVVVIDPIIDPIVPGNGLDGGLVPEIGDILPVSIEETPQSALRYRFGGKEIAGQKVGASAVLGAPAGTPAAAAGRPYLDFGARLYDPRTAAWLAPDPMAEKYYPISPYAYCAGNPVNLVDPDGMWFTDSSLSIVQTLMDDIITRITFIEERQLYLSSLISEGGLSDNQIKSANILSSLYSRETSRLNKVVQEISILASSNQVYNVFYSDRLNTSTEYVSGTEYNFETNELDIILGDRSLGSIAHELKHAYQFEVGSFSSGPGGLPFYDQTDEREAYERGELFDGPHYKVLPGVYLNLSPREKSASSLPEFYLNRNDPSVLQQKANRFNRIAFRVNGITYVSNKK